MGQSSIYSSHSLKNIYYSCGSSRHSVSQSACTCDWVEAWLSGDVFTLTWFSFFLNLNRWLSDGRMPDTMLLKPISHRARLLSRPSSSIHPSIHPPMSSSVLSSCYLSTGCYASSLLNWSLFLRFSFCQGACRGLYLYHISKLIKVEIFWCRVFFFLPDTVTDAGTWEMADTKWPLMSFEWHTVELKTLLSVTHLKSFNGSALKVFIVFTW